MLKLKAVNSNEKLIEPGTPVDNKPFCEMLESNIVMW